MIPRLGIENLKNHTLSGDTYCDTYLCSPYMGVAPPPGWPGPGLDEKRKRMSYPFQSTSLDWSSLITKPENQRSLSPFVARLPQIGAIFRFGWTVTGLIRSGVTFKLLVYDGMTQYRATGTSSSRYPLVSWKCLCFRYRVNARSIPNLPIPRAFVGHFFTSPFQRWGICQRRSARGWGTVKDSLVFRTLKVAYGSTPATPTCANICPIVSTCERENQRWQKEGRARYVKKFQS